jgi:predicted MPP superfamily phosphohydrolase
MHDMQAWIKRMAVVAAGTSVAAALYAWFVERARVQLNRFTIQVDKPGLPPGGLTVLHLSDLHCRADGQLQERKLARLQRLLADEPYDIVALTGDLIHDAAGFSRALTFISRLRPRLGTYFCRGNHDYCESSLWGIVAGNDSDGVEKADGGAGSAAGKGAPSTDVTWAAEGAGAARSARSRGQQTPGLVTMARRLLDFARKLQRNERVHLPMIYHDMQAMEEALAGIGVHSLVNRAAHIEKDETDLWMAGVDDLWEGTADLAEAVAEVPAGKLLLLLAHNPDVWLDPCVERADLVLCGHVHGGQVRLPILGALHTQGTHLTRRKPAGWFRRDTTRMFVSRGVGESLPMRFGAVPQAVLIRIVHA